MSHSGNDYSTGDALVRWSPYLSSKVHMHLGGSEVRCPGVSPNFATELGY